MRISTKQEGMFALLVVGAVLIVSVWSTNIGVLIAVVALTAFAINEFRKEMRPGQPMNPLTAVNEARQQERARNREKLMDYLDSHDSLTNDDVERILNVSDSGATSYLDELEKEGLLKQVGDEGRGVHYRKNG